MHRARLEREKAVLTAVSLTEKPFDMTAWVFRELGDPVCHTTACAAGHYQPDKLDEYWDFGAAAAFFGLSYRSACYLFDPEAYTIEAENYDTEPMEEEDAITAADVIARIDVLLANDGIAPGDDDDEP